MQAAASGNLVDRLAAHVEALWPVSEAVAALASGGRTSSTHAQATRHGERPMPNGTSHSSNPQSGIVLG